MFLTEGSKLWNVVLRDLENILKRIHTKCRKMAQI